MTERESEWQQGEAGPGSLFQTLLTADDVHVQNVYEASRVWGREDRNQSGRCGHSERLRQSSLQTWLRSA